MGNSILRQHIRKILSEFFNNSWVYTYGPNKFPQEDGNPKTPSDLDSQFDSEFNFLPDVVEDESISESDKEESVNKKIFPKKP